MQQPPRPPPKKKSRKGLFIILGVILAIALIGCIGVVALVNTGGRAVNQTSTQVAQSPTPQPTTQPTPTQPACEAVNNNPWCYNFSPGNLIYNPPSNFCDYFTCVSIFGLQLLVMLLSVSMNTIRIRVGCVVLVPTMVGYSNHCMRVRLCMS